MYEASGSGTDCQADIGVVTYEALKLDSSSDPGCQSVIRELTYNIFGYLYVRTFS